MKIKFSNFTPQENLISILPSIVAGILVLLATVVTSLLFFPPQNLLIKNFIIAFGIAGSLYLAFYYVIFNTSVNKSRFTWLNVIVSGATLSALTFFIPEDTV